MKKISDSNEYYIYTYLVTYESHFAILFKSEYFDEYILKDKQFSFYNLQNVIFEIIGNEDIILDEFEINSIINKKK